MRQHAKKDLNAYPFGLQHKGYNGGINGVENNYQTFQGQEHEKELGKETYAFQWRDYDPAIARFNKIDRFTEEYTNMSPYHFTSNNPISFREIKGDSINVAKIYERNDDGEYKNPNQVKAFESFAKTKTGYNYLSQFAAKGQKVGNLPSFKADGKLHTEKMDIVFGTEPTQDGASGTTGLEQKNGRWEFSVNFNDSSNKVYDNAQALTHELFVHVENYLGDLKDNNLKDYSNMPTFINNSTTTNQRHHRYEVYMARNQKPTLYNTKGYGIMNHINKTYKKYETTNEIWLDLFDGL